MDTYKVITRKLLESSNAPVEVTVLVDKFPSWAIQVNYGAGTGSTGKLQASVDYKPAIGTTPEQGNWSDISDSSQALDDAGGVHIWNCNGMQFWAVRVILDGDAVDCEIWISESRNPS